MLVGLSPFRSAGTSHSITLPLLVPPPHHGASSEQQEDGGRAGRRRKRRSDDDAAAASSIVRSVGTEELEQLCRKCAITIIPKDDHKAGPRKRRGKKRSKKRKHRDASAGGIIEVSEPAAAVTTSHSISVVLSECKPDQDAKESSRWCYQSRPGASTSFLPVICGNDDEDKDEEHSPIMNGENGKKKMPAKRGEGRKVKLNGKAKGEKHVNAIVPSVPSVMVRSSSPGFHPLSCALFALRGGNSTLCSWDGDDSTLEGPDGYEGSVWSASFPDGIAAVSMEPLPQSVGLMGVCGSLTDGTVYVALLSTLADDRGREEEELQLVMGRFGEPLQCAAVLFASASVDTSLDGSVAVSVLSRTTDSKVRGNLKLCRHTLSDLHVAVGKSGINPNEAESVDTDENDATHHVKGKKKKAKKGCLLEGQHTCTSMLALLPSDFDPASAKFCSMRNGGLAVAFRVASLEPGSKGGDNSASWYLVALDPTVANAATPISARPLCLPPSSAFVTALAALSNCIVAVISRSSSPASSTSTLSLYDVQRMALLHSTKLTGPLLLDGTEEDSQPLSKKENALIITGLASDPAAGTFAILHASPVGGKGGVASARLGVSLSKLSMSDDEQAGGYRGGYNLAAALSSSASLSLQNRLLMSSSIASAKAAGLSSLLGDDGAGRKGREKKEDPILRTFEGLQAFLRQAKGNKGRGTDGAGFGGVYFKAAASLTRAKTKSSVEKAKRGKKTHGNFPSVHDPAQLPTRFVALALPVAANLLLARTSSVEARRGAAMALVDLLRSGQASVRGTILDSDRRMRSILAACSRAYRTRGVGGPTSLDVIDALLRHCADSLSERGLAAMARYILVAVGEDEMDAFFSSGDGEREDDRTRRVRERRDAAQDRLAELHAKAKANDAAKTNAQHKTPAGKRRRKNPSSETEAKRAAAEDNGDAGKDSGTSGKEILALETQCRDLSGRLVALRTVSLVGRIASASPCNGAMLRSALREEGGLAATPGALDALLRALGRALHWPQAYGVGTTPASLSGTARIADWMSALADASRPTSSGGDDAGASSIRAARGAVRAAVAQADALFGADALLEQVQRRWKEENMLLAGSGRSGVRSLDGTSAHGGAAVPPYSIEKLVF
mmetsp:Transcript_8230/g.24687  ORF Transcript_8230/g.24687 Transcript_8230/m.24687 type:complete len:1129 (-) Transcript_8230:838-4224(-)